jgi:hypothetical protein
VGKGIALVHHLFDGLNLFHLVLIKIPVCSFPTPDSIGLRDVATSLPVANLFLADPAELRGVADAECFFSEFLHIYSPSNFILGAVEDHALCNNKRLHNCPPRTTSALPVRGRFFQHQDDQCPLLKNG